MEGKVTKHLELMDFKTETPVKTKPTSLNCFRD